jgi:hypothetical protein
VAFIKAWSIVKRGGLTLDVRGVSYGSRQEALRRLTAYDPARVKALIVPEPSNPADPAALAVIVFVTGRGSYRLGYVPREQIATVRAMKVPMPALRVLAGKVNRAKITLEA